MCRMLTFNLQDFTNENDEDISNSHFMSWHILMNAVMWIVNI